MVEDDRARRRGVRAERSGVAHARHPRRIGVADWTVRDQRAKRVADVYFAGHSEGGRRSLSKVAVEPGVSSKVQRGSDPTWITLQIVRDVTAPSDGLPTNYPVS